jgi:hypothetical protein
MEYLQRGEIYYIQKNNSNNVNNSFNNLIEKITTIVTPNDLEVIQGYIKNISRDNMINIIGIIRTNKYNFNSLNQKNLYNKIIDELYKQLDYKFNKIEKKVEQLTNKFENKDFNDCYDGIFNLINNMGDIQKPEFKNHVLEKMYGLRMLIQINDYKKNNSDDSIVPKPYYELESEPIQTPIEETKKPFIFSFIRFILKINENIIGKENKVICVMTLYDFVFRNYDFLIKNYKFAVSVYNKIIELIRDNSNIIVDISMEYYNKPNIIFIWRDHIKNLIDNA